MVAAFGAPTAIVGTLMVWLVLRQGKSPPSIWAALLSLIFSLITYAGIAPFVSESMAEYQSRGPWLACVVAAPITFLVCLFLKSKKTT
jgi:hypothetical protein